MPGRTTSVLTEPCTFFGLLLFSKLCSLVDVKKRPRSTHQPRGISFAVTLPKERELAGVCGRVVSLEDAVAGIRKVCTPVKERMASGIPHAASHSNEAIPRQVSGLLDAVALDLVLAQTSVDILQANDVVLVELAEGYLKDPHRSATRGRKAMHSHAGDKDPFPALRPND